MTDEKSERIALKADEDSVIIADRAKISGFDKTAEATNRSYISLEGAITDSKSKNQNDNDSNRGPWYKKPIGIVVLTVIAGLVVLFVEKLFFNSIS